MRLHKAHEQLLHCCRLPEALGLDLLHGLLPGRGLEPRLEGLLELLELLGFARPPRSRRPRRSFTLRQLLQPGLGLGVARKGAQGEVEELDVDLVQGGGQGVAVALAREDALEGGG